jgi:hypothetical protein
MAVLALFVFLAGCSPGDAARLATPSPARGSTIASAQILMHTPTPGAQTPVPASATTTPSAIARAPLTPTAQPAPPPTPTVDQGADFVRAMRPGFAGDVAGNASLPRYMLRMRIAPDQGRLDGAEQIVFPNRTGAPLADVALRLYPNFPRDVFGKGGDVRMDVSGAAVAGQPIEARYAAQRTAVILPLPRPLDPGGAITLAITFTATIVPWRDGTWPLPSYYPLLAVRDGDRWRTDVTRFADRVYAESAFYAAEISVPANLSLVASGSTLATRPGSEGDMTYSVRGGPLREFAFAVGDFDAVHARAGAQDDVAVNVYVARGSGLDARQIARVAAGALADFDRRFGLYPYAELDIQLLPYDYDGGDEYPGLILLYSDGQVDAGTRYVTAHEVAHQWWYGLVGNDIYRQPWLDETFAQYSGIIYDEDIAGASVAAADWQREVLRRYQGALADGDLPIDLAIDGYPNFNVYYRTVYGKGAVFLRRLREQLGDDTFFKALHAYYRERRYGVATTADILRAFEQASGRDLRDLFRGWVTGVN